LWVLTGWDACWLPSLGSIDRYIDVLAALKGPASGWLEKGLTACKTTEVISKTYLAYAYGMLYRPISGLSTYGRYINPHRRHGQAVSHHNSRIWRGCSKDTLSLLNLNLSSASYFARDVTLRGMFISLGSWASVVLRACELTSSKQPRLCLKRAVLWEDLSLKLKGT
jgi:hypothetical protein